MSHYHLERKGEQVSFIGFAYFFRQVNNAEYVFLCVAVHAHVRVFSCFLP